MPLTGVPFAGESIEVTVRAARTYRGRITADTDSGPLTGMSEYPPLQLR